MCNRLFSGILCIQLFFFTGQVSAEVLSVGNTPVPFSYVKGKTRTWNVFADKLGDDTAIQLRITRDGELTDTSLSISLSRTGVLSVESPEHCEDLVQIEVKLIDGQTVMESQTLQLQPAPSQRPLSYVSDLVDDLIRMNWNPSKGQFNPVSKPVFDSYFRRLQAQGITRLIVWQSVFPLINDPDNYKPEDWNRFEAQSHAILDCDELSDILRASSKLESYQWLLMLTRLRLTTDFDQFFTASAKEHGIKLTASYRPFEAALTKYYEVPTFDFDGRYLWGFLPGGSPALNYNIEEICFAHYREVLKKLGRQDEATIDRVEFGGIAQIETIQTRLASGIHDLELVASAIAPMDETSFVLVRNATGEFKLCRFSEIATTVFANETVLTDVELAVKGNTLVATGLQLPKDGRYLFLRQKKSSDIQIDLSAVPDVSVYAKSGDILGRNNVYFAINGDDPGAIKTRVAGIPSDGMYHTDFQAIEASIDYFRRNKLSQMRLSTGTLVIDLLPSHSMEMIDFNLPASRDFVVRELKTIMKYDAFDELFINTRTHTQLGGATSDGVLGVKPMAAYRLNGTRYYHYGRDRAYAPISIGESEAFKNADIQSITCFQDGEWMQACQSKDSPYVWRYQRNRAIANGVEKLLQRLETEFPNTRIRAVIPQSEQVINKATDAITSMPKPDGGVYGKDYFRHVWGSLNHIPAIGEGMAMVDLSGLKVEPVFLGIRYAPDDGPINAFVNPYIEFLNGNLGSSYRGPKSFFYEAQETLRARGTELERTRNRREKIIRDLLARPEIDEIILYESADWLFNIPFTDRAFYGYDFLDE